MFRAMGLDRGDRVCLFLPNCPEFLLCWFGLSAMGAICVPINTAYKRDEAAYILNNSGARMLVAHDSLLPVAEQAAALATGLERKLVVGSSSSPSEDYLTVLAGQRQWIATTNFAGCPGRPPDSFANSAVLTTSAKVLDALGWPIAPCFPVQIDPKAEPV